MINIDDYKTNIRDFIKRRGFSCLYLISCSDGMPTKIGIASDIYTRLNALQVGNWVKLELQYILWLPGRAASELVEKELHRKYEDYSIGGEWFNLHYSNIYYEIDTIARVLYPSVTLATHSDMIEHARKKIDGKYDRVLARFGLGK